MALVSRADFGSMHCSMARALDVIGDPWTPLVLRDLLMGLTRFEQLAANLGISRNLLTRRLEHLVEAHVVERSAYQDHPPRYDYRLTEAGRDLVPVLIALTAWGDRWVAPKEGPPVRFRHRCGEVFDPVVTCPACQEPVTTDNVRALPGPGARAADGTRLLGARRGKPS
jgi:DNA-binding HxlR family transcriptional regulator